MSREDFCRCTPSEFAAIWSSWRDHETYKERSHWERVRMQCLCTLQPYSSQQLTARDVLRFPWDTEEQTQSEEAEGEEMTVADKKRRFDEVKKQLGLV